MSGEWVLKEGDNQIATFSDPLDRVYLGGLEYLADRALH